MQSEVVFEAAITPVPKPRMTRSDRWKKRPGVERYWQYKDDLITEALLQDFKVPAAGYHVIFYMPMPKSWSKKEKERMNGQPHQAKPDKDNLEKAFLDALCDDDSYVYDGRVSKYWAQTGGIKITKMGVEDGFSK